MISDDFHIIIEKLIEKTKANKANWKKANRKNAFLIDFKNGKIIIDFFPGSDNEPSSISVSLYNKNSEVLEKMIIENTTMNENDFNKYLNMYNLIEDKYYKKDETISGILNEIKNNEIIGTKDDDNPFF